MQRYYSTIADEYDQKYGKTLSQLERELRARREFIAFKQGGRLLDYACGTGLISKVYLYPIEAGRMGHVLIAF